jgi:hypothetical protein
LNGLADPKINTNTLVTNNPSLWIQCFDCVARNPALASISHLVLKTYTHLPDQEVLSPNPSSVLLLMKSYLTTSLRHISDLTLLFDLWSKLKRISSTNKILDKDSVLQAVSEVELEGQIAISKLLQNRSLGITFNEVLNYGKQLGDSIMDYKTIVDRLQVEGKMENEHDDVPIYMLWSQNPPLKWLMSAEWLLFPPLQSQYSSVENYATAIRGLWTALSFYWGAAAVMPRCYHHDMKGNNNNNDSNRCLEPMLTPSTHSECCTSRIQDSGGGQRVCGNPAKWCCFRRGHDAICSTCLDKKRKFILGPPKHYLSSTDIYDAIVKNVKVSNDSPVLQLHRVESRKPPERDVNWSTSYRLQPTSLVAVISLPAYGMALDPNSKIHWGEIVASDPKQDSRDEYNNRRRGELSVRLLTRNDSTLIANEFERGFQINYTVAVIDLRVFVPEVISVLSTLSSREFENSLHRLHFAPLLLGDVPSATLLESSTTVNLDLHGMIYNSIIKSDMQCIQELSSSEKNQLVDEICKLSVVKTMDKTQLQAFTNALRCSVHCTQGPPGTGKVKTYKYTYCSFVI